MRRAILLWACCLLLPSAGSQASVFDDLLQDFAKAGQGKTPSSEVTLSDQDVTRGLKDALGEGASHAVSLLGRMGGFWQNDAVRIPLPRFLQQAEPVLNVLGQGQKLEDLKLALNRAAEAAVPQAKTLLVDAIKNMSVADAKSVLTGGDDAATQYFRQATSDKLQARFLPIVKQTVNRLKLSEQYDKVAASAAQAGLLDQNQSNMASYVTSKALDGLFLMIAEEEKAIRRDPLGRSSAYIRKVFGSLK